MEIETTHGLNAAGRTAARVSRVVRARSLGISPDQAFSKPAPWQPGSVDVTFVNGCSWRESSRAPYWWIF